MCLTYNTHWPFVKSYALPKKVTNQQRKHTKTGKESKKDQEGRRKKEEQSKNHFYFSVDCPNIDVLSLIWSPACFAAERNSTLGKTAGTNMPNYFVEKGFKELGTKIYKCNGTLPQLRKKFPTRIRTRACKFRGRASTRPLPSVQNCKL